MKCNLQIHMILDFIGFCIQKEIIVIRLLKVIYKYVIYHFKNYNNAQNINTKCIPISISNLNLFSIYK